MDSVDKIVTRYFSTMTKEDFTYKGKVYVTKPLKVSPLLLRDYTCPAFCGACCSRFSLDYLPNEEHPYPLQKRIINFDNKEVLIYSDEQKDHTNHHCRNLSQEDARCGIYTTRPFSCDFELIRTLSFQHPNSPNVLTQKLFGRGWAMKRIDGGRGSQCEMIPVTDYSIDEVIRKMKRLEEWCDHFGVVNRCQEIITWIGEVRHFVFKFDKMKPILLK